MYKIFFLLILTLIFHNANSQCACKNKITEGTNMKICQPKPVAFDNKYQIALSAIQIEDSEFVVLTVRFRLFAETVGSNLQLSFSDSDHILNLELVNSGKDYIGNSEICHARFRVTDHDKNILSKSKILTVRFRYTNDDLSRTFKAAKNATVIKEHLSCL